MNPRIKDWSGKRVWIVGASTGIGAQVATLLLEAGARVALSARRASLLEELADADPYALVLPLDVTNLEDVRAAATTMVHLWGGIDLLLVCAGGYTEMRADENFDLPTATALIDLNLRGPLHCLDAVLPVMLAQGNGSLALVSSVAGFRGLPRALAYGPTKAALINLAEALYLDLRPRGIGVHLINPGFVDTPLTKSNPFPMPALMSAERAAEALITGLERGQFHIHFPRRFTFWMRLARLLPYPLYFPLVRKVTGL